MPHFFIDSKKINNNLLIVDDAETVHHLTGSLRIQNGEVLKFIDENKIQYLAKITDFSKKEVRAEILRSEKSNRELNYNIFLAQSVLKTDAQNLLISNAAQLGIRGVYPFVSEFSTVKSTTAKLKAEKWQKISDEAFKQCERADRMAVFEILPINAILKKFKKENIIIFAERDENTDVLSGVKTADLGSDILIITGPEGGFSDNEFEFFKANKYNLATLGNLIFKAPNAVTAGISNVVFAISLYEKGIIN